MSTMDWLTILIAAAGGLGGAGLAHGLARGQIASLKDDSSRMWRTLREMRADMKEENRELRARLDRRINGNGTNQE